MEGFDTSHESYTLTISTDGVQIRSEFWVGAVRALSSLAQLVKKGETGIRIQNTPLSITDKPRFPYRSFMLDVSREFYEVDDVLRVIDALALSKINYFHIHLSDDDSMLLELPSFPDLITYTGHDDKTQRYTVEDMKLIVSRAKSYGIKVVPEVDFPGHSYALGNYPEFSELVVCQDHIKQWEMVDGSYIHGGPINGVWNPAKEETYDAIL